MGREIEQIIDNSPKRIKEETTEKIEKTIAKRGGPIDIFEVRGGRPDVEYCWLNTRKDALEFEKLRGKWEIVNSTNDPNVKTVADKGEGGTHIIGDAILALRSKEIGEAERRAVKEMMDRRKRRVSEEFRESARGTGIKIIE